MNPLSFSMMVWLCQQSPSTFLFISPLLLCHCRCTLQSLSLTHFELFWKCNMHFVGTYQGAEQGQDLFQPKIVPIIPQSYLHWNVHHLLSNWFCRQSGHEELGIAFPHNTILIRDSSTFWFVSMSLQLSIHDHDDRLRVEKVCPLMRKDQLLMHRVHLHL